MNTDCFFSIGSTHKVCQDYALADSSVPYVIICDGCSSANHSDFGARLLAVAAAQHIRNGHLQETWFFHSVLSQSNTIAKTLGIPGESLSATLMIASIIDDVFVFRGMGDGMVAVRNRHTGELEMHEIIFPSGAPYYLRYELSRTDKDEYIQSFGAELEYTITYEGVPGTIVHTRDALVPTELRFPFHDYDLLALSSDGVRSFMSKDVTDTGIQNHIVYGGNIIKDVLSFRGYQGEYVQRRCRKAFFEFGKNGWNNTDDFSLAVIAL